MLVWCKLEKVDMEYGLGFVAGFTADAGIHV